MADQFIGEIRMMGFGFAPRGWAKCEGQSLPINQNQALFALIGVTFGGNGTTNFNLPDFRGRMPIHVGPGYGAGVPGGEATHSLANSEIPSHTHTAFGTSAAAEQVNASGALLAVTTKDVYAGLDKTVELVAGTIGQAGEGQPHENMQPYAVLNFCIALEGLYPPRN